MEQSALIRQRDIFPGSSTPITIIGAGGIGSPTVEVLAKMGCSNIMVYDNDIVSVENLNTQKYCAEEIGIPKVLALRDYIKKYTDIVITARQELFIDQPLAGIVISAVDNMETRRKVFELCKMNPEVTYLIDGRMGGEGATVFAINPMSSEETSFYNKHCFSDEEADDLPCTARSIGYNTSIIAGVLGATVKNILTMGTAGFKRMCIISNMIQHTEAC